MAAVKIKAEGDGRWTATCPTCQEPITRDAKNVTCGAVQAHMVSQHDYPAFKILSFQEVK